jgi:hypothetical protein
MGNRGEALVMSLRGGATERGDGQQRGSSGDATKGRSYGERGRATEERL